MKSTDPAKSLALKVSMNSFLIILFAFTFLQIVNYVRDALLLHAGALTDFLSSYANYMGTRVLPVTVLFVIILFLGARPIQKVIARLSSGETVPTELLDATRRRILRFRRLVVILNLIGFTVGHVLNIFLTKQAHNFFYFNNVLTLIFNLVSGVVYASIQNSVNDLIFTAPRELLGIHSIGKSRMELGTHVKSVVLTVFICAYGLLFFLKAQVDIHEHDLVYASQLEQVARGELGLQQTESAYRQTISRILSQTSSRVQLESDDIVLPMNLSVLDRTRANRAIFIILLVFVLAVAAVTQLTSSAGTRRQLLALREKLRDMTRGEGALDTRVNITRFDEIGSLADHINRFVGKLHALINRATEVSREVGDSSDSINQSIDSALAAVQELQAASQQVSQNTSAQIKVAEDTQDSFSVMLRTIDTITQSVDAQATSVEQTSSAIEQMASSIQSVSSMAEKADQMARGLAGIASEGGQAVGDSISAIREIEQASLEVANIVSLISGIATQTDLLAINAAIEAAHAGDHGRGFAVVADEVRQLAENSAGQAREIVGQIDVMTERIKNGVKLSEQVGEALSKIATDTLQAASLIQEISNAMQEQAVGAQQIVAAITSVVEATHAIRSQTMSQQEQNDTIRTSVENLVKVSAEINQSADEQSKGNQSILESVYEVLQNASRNSEVVKSLNEILGGFASGRETDSQGSSS